MLSSSGCVRLENNNASKNPLMAIYLAWITVKSTYNNFKASQEINLSINKDRHQVQGLTISEQNEIIIKQEDNDGAVKSGYF